MRTFKFLLLILLLLPVSRVFPKQISSDQAKLIARKVLTQNSTRSSLALSLVYTAKEKGSKRSESLNNYYYVFNVGENKGFVIVSADDVNVPVIGYSEAGSYDENNLPLNFQDWMLTVENGMKKAISEKSSPSELIQRKWKRYLSNKADNVSETAPISPLLQTKWGQAKPYYNMTPVINSTRTYTGCVATAMAQLMKYYEHPQNIDNVITLPSYTIYKWGLTINSIDVSNSVFDWSNMTDEYNYFNGTPPNEDQENAIAKLMYYCGVSARMDYDIIGSGGSSAASYDAAKAFYTYWGYDKNLSYLYRSTSSNSFSDEEWIEMIKTDLNEGRPVYYNGTSTTGGGHAFVCDGIDDNGLFHFNWGWEGSQDGYYDINSPLNYVLNHGMITNLKPDEGGRGIPLYVVHDFDQYPSVVPKEEAFRVDCSVSDLSIHQLDTVYYLAIYDEADNFIEKISFWEYRTGQSTSMPRCIISESVPLGDYVIKAVLLKNDGTYTPINIREGEAYPVITVSDDIVEHNLKIFDEKFTSSISSGEAGDSFTATLSFITKGISFSGDWGMALVDKDDLTIKYILSESTGKKLDAGSYYPSYTFQCILPEKIIPGEYKLMMYARLSGKELDFIVRGYDDKAIESLDFRVLGDPVNIETDEVLQIKLYPNPIKDILFIDASETVEQVQCYDINGKLLFEKTSVTAHDFGNLPAGIYVLKIKTATALSTHKLVKE